MSRVSKYRISASVIISLALGVTSLASPILQPMQAYADTTTSTSQYNQGQLYILNYINNLRQHMGEQPVQMNPILVQSASAHTNYILLNNSYMTEGHNETSGLQGFTGATVRDRVTAAGGSSLEAVHEDLANASYDDSIVGLINAPNHRDSLLEPQIQCIGVSNQDGDVTIDTADYNTTPSSIAAQSEVYPYNGETDVPIDFGIGEEDAANNPLTPLGISESGYMITYFTPGNVLTNSVNFKLTDSNGNNVPFYTDEYVDNSFGGHFFAKQPLQYSTTYTCSVSYNDINTGQHYSYSWSFTTEANPDPNPTPQQWTPPSNPGTFNPNSFTNNGTTYYATKLEYQMQPIAYPSHITAYDSGNLTSFLPLFYVNEALAPYGYKGTWDGNTWNITTTPGTDIDMSNLPSQRSTDSSTLAIAINGTVVQYAPRQVAGDPSNTYQDTTYLPIWYISQVLKRLAITADWDGTTWNIF